MTINHFPLHIGDFLGGTIGMDATETGAYIMLIVAHYQAGENGLKNDDVLLARIAKVSTKVWSRIKERIAVKFDITIDFWRHKRVVEELRKIADIRADNSAKALKQQEARRAGALQRHSQPITNSQEPYKKEKDLPNGRSKKIGMRLPVEWKISHDGWLFAEAHGLTEQQALTESDKFRDYWHSISGQKGVKNDWDATWRNWIRNRRTENGKSNKTERARAAILESSEALGFGGEQGSQTGIGEHNFSVFPVPEVVRQGTGDAREHQRDVSIRPSGIHNGKNLFSNDVLPEVQQRNADASRYSDDNREEEQADVQGISLCFDQPEKIR